MKDRRLWLLLAVALGIRLALMPLPDPFEADLSTFWRPWMAFGAQHGLAQLYQHGQPTVNYPPFYLTLLSGLGMLYRLVSPEMAPSPLQSFLIKLPAVVADLVVTVMLYMAGLRMVGEVDKGTRKQGCETGSRSILVSLSTSPLVSPSTLPLLAAALWAFNPAAIYVSAYWAQVDAIHTMWMMAALLAALAGRWGWSGVLMALGLLTKLQAIVLLPLLVFLAWRAGWAKVLRLGLAAAAALALGLLPFLLSGSLNEVLAVYFSLVGYFPKLTVNAFNPWLFVQYLGVQRMGLDLTDNVQIVGPVTFRMVGFGLMAVYAGLVLWALHRSLGPRRQGSDQPRYAITFFAAGLFVFGFFMLTTEMHERYVLPALAFLALPACLSRRLLVAYALLTASITANLLRVLPFSQTVFNLMQAVPGDRLIVAAVNLALFVWLTYCYLRLARRASRQPQMAAAAPLGMD